MNGETSTLQLNQEKRQKEPQNNDARKILGMTGFEPSNNHRDGLNPTKSTGELNLACLFRQKTGRSLLALSFVSRLTQKTKFTGWIWGFSR